MYLLLWTFFAYAFLGWCTEVSYAALHTGHFVNRGFLNGPVCPIYGFGVLLILTVLEPLRSNQLLLFLGCVALTSLLEWLTGFVLEKLFHQRWWDYSTEPFNLNGYICLRFSILWGLACLFVLEILHPTILWLIRHIPHPLGLALLGLFSLIMLVDLVATVRTITRLNHQLSQIDELASGIKKLSNELGESLADRVLDAVELGNDWKEDLSRTRADLQENWEELLTATEHIKEAFEQLRFQLRIDQAQWLDQHLDALDELRTHLDEALNRRIFGQKRLLAAFPHMRSTRHRQTSERLRRWLDRH